MTVQPVPTYTASALVAGDAVAEALERAGVAREALSGVAVTAPLLQVVGDRIAEAVEDQLAAIGLGDLVMDAWAEVGELRDALASTRADPGAPVDVVLGDHEITSEHHPAVEVLLDERRTATVTFDLTLRLHLREAVAVVRAGRVAGLRAAHVTGMAQLAWRGRDLLTPTPVPILAGLLVPVAGRSGPH